MPAFNFTDRRTAAKARRNKEPASARNISAGSRFGRRRLDLLNRNRTGTTKITFAGETQAEADARRAAGGLGQRPEDFTPSNEGLPGTGVNVVQGGTDARQNVGILGGQLPRFSRGGLAV